MARICSYVPVAQFVPQVLHNPLNTGVDGNAHVMHKFMNSAPFTS